MVRLPLSPRTSASGRRHPRSSWEVAGSGGRPKFSSGYLGDGDAENVEAYNSQSRLATKGTRSGGDALQAIAAKSSSYLQKWQHLQPMPSPKKRFTPNRNSPTWRSVQSEQRGASTFGDEDATGSANAGSGRAAGRIRETFKGNETGSAKKASLTSFVEKHKRYDHQESGNASASIASSHKSGQHKSSQKGKQAIVSCPSSDSTTSSLIYSLGDTVKSSSSNMMLEDTHKAGSNISETISAAEMLLRGVHQSAAPRAEEAKREEEDTDVSTLGLTVGRSIEEEEGCEEGKEEDQAAELVASTLAECRLLLAMSPPPTPAARPSARPMERPKEVMKEEKPEEKPQHRVEKEPEEWQPPPPKPAQPRRAPESTSGLADVLACPSCATAFRDSLPGSHPLHSFACDHIVCRDCVLDAGRRSDGTMVACPACDEPRAFDAARPVVSRMYLNLVRKMQAELGVSEGGTNADEAGKTKERQAIPSQICVPSPTAKDHPEDGASLATTDMGSKASSSASSSSRSRRRGGGRAGLTVDVASPTAFLAASADPAVRVEEEGEEDGKEEVEEEVGEAASGANGGRGHDVPAVADPTTTSLAEPTTPVSRAEHRFRQRKEKLAQSLERVNKILERSRAVKEAGLTAERSAHETVAEKEEEGSPPAVKHMPSRLRTELRVDTGEIPTFSPIRSSTKAQLRGRTAEARRKRGEAAASAPQPVVSPLAATPVDVDAPIATASANAKQQWGSVDIFRIDSAEEDGPAGGPKTIEFGANFGSSPMSSCDGGDTLFLLPDHRPKPDAAASVPSKVKEYLAKGGPLSVERRPQRLSSFGGEPRKCPQFLPSLTYSTMRNEADGLAGLVDPRDAAPSPVWGAGAAASVGGLSFLSSPGVKRARKPKRSGGNGLFKQLALSFDEAFRPASGNATDNVVFGRLESPADRPWQPSGAGQNGDQPSLGRRDEENCPTYAFSVPSCSLSPSSHDNVGGYGSSNRTSMTAGRVEDGPLGALVTHRPRGLHKRLFKKFAKKGRK